MRETPVRDSTRDTEEAPAIISSDDLDEALLAARMGDETGFRLVFQAAQPGLLRYLRVLVGADAEDVASETWLQVARDIASFDGDWRGFRGWTATIARHRAIDHARRERRRTDVATPVERFLDVPAADDTAHDALDALSTDQAVAMIATLPKEQAEAVMLRVVIGLDANESGRILNRRPGTVRTAAHRGLRRLAADLGQAGSW